MSPDAGADGGPTMGVLAVWDDEEGDGLHTDRSVFEDEIFEVERLQIVVETLFQQDVRPRNTCHYDRD